MFRGLVAILLATAVLRAQDPALDAVLLRAAEYVSQYQQQLRGLVAEESYRVWLNGFTADGKIPLKDLQEIYDEALAAKLIPSAVPVPRVMDYTWVDEVLKEKR